MAPDRPDASSMDSLHGNNVTRVLDATKVEPQEDVTTEEENAFDGNDARNDEQVEPSNGTPSDKNAHSDDDLKPLSWLIGQNNLLKDLEVTSPSKSVKEENILNNNVYEESASLSENTNSVSSLDENCSPGNCRFIDSLERLVSRLCIKCNVKFIT